MFITLAECTEKAMSVDGCLRVFKRQMCYFRHKNTQRQKLLNIQVSQMLICY